MKNYLILIAIMSFSCADSEELIVPQSDKEIINTREKETSTVDQENGFTINGDFFPLEGIRFGCNEDYCQIILGDLEGNFVAFNNIYWTGEGDYNLLPFHQEGIPEHENSFIQASYFSNSLIRSTDDNAYGCCEDWPKVKFSINGNNIDFRILEMEGSFAFDELNELPSVVSDQRIDIAETPSLGGIDILAKFSSGEAIEGCFLPLDASESRGERLEWIFKPVDAVSIKIGTAQIVQAIPPGGTEEKDFMAFIENDDTIFSTEQIVSEQSEIGILPLDKGAFDITLKVYVGSEYREITRSYTSQEFPRSIAADSLRFGLSLDDYISTYQWLGCRGEYMEFD